MALNIQQRKAVTAAMQELVARTLERQLVSAARDVVLAAREVHADDLPFAKDEDVTPTIKKPTVEDNPTEQKWLKEKSRFALHDDRAKLANQLAEDQQSLDHAMRWLVSYFKALKPAIDKFSRKMIRFDAVNFNQSHLNQLTGIVRAVLKLVETLDAAGATASDVTETIQTLERQLSFKSSQDSKRGLKWF